MPTPNHHRTYYIPLDQIHVNPDLSVRWFPVDDGTREFADLVASIRRDGLLEPILVRSVNGHYEVLAGQRRRKACMRAGLREALCIVREGLSDDDAIRISLVENLRRQNLSPIDLARVIVDQLDGKMTTEEMETLLGMRQCTIFEYRRLYGLDIAVQKQIHFAHIQATGAFEIAGLPGDVQQQVAEAAVEEQIAIEEERAEAKARTAEQAEELDPASPNAVKARFRAGKAAQVAQEARESGPREVTAKAVRRAVEKVVPEPPRSSKEPRTLKHLLELLTAQPAGRMYALLLDWSQRRLTDEELIEELRLEVGDRRAAA